MIARLIDFSLRQRALVFFGALVLIGAGLWSAWHLPIDAVPDITGVQVQINTEVPAFAPEEVEKLVTLPLETALAGTPGVRELRSLSKFALSQLTLQFADGTDIYRARQLVGERLAGIARQLPPGLAPQLAPVTTGLSEIVYYTLDYTADAPDRPATRREQLMELLLLHEYRVKPSLRSVPGIAEVNTIGGYEKQIVVEPRLDRLRAAGLTVDELAHAIAANVENAGGGIVSRGGRQFFVRAVGRVQSAEEVAALPVKFSGTVQPLLVRDLADVGIGSAVRTGAATVEGEEAVIGTAMMLIGENSRTVARRVEQRLARIQAQLPAGVELRPLYQRSALIDATLRTVETNLFEGAILVIAVLFALLGNWRAALIVAAAIPLAFLCALIGLHRLGLSGNLMSLGAIDFGLIIDGAVVIVENIVRLLGSRARELGRPLSAAERRDTIGVACRQVGRPMFFGVLIITAVYVPILALSGIEGKMFHPLAIAVMCALGGALVLALTAIPALCSVALRGHVPARENFLVRFAHRLYAPTLAFALRTRVWFVAGAVALCMLAALVFTRLGAEFIAQLDEGSFALMVFRDPAISLDETLAQQRATDRHLRERIPEITQVFARLGTSEIATDPMPQSDGDVYVSYRPRSEWRRENGRPITKTQLGEIVRAEVEAANPGAAILVSQPIEMRFNELLEGIRADLAVKIYGENYDVTERIAADIKELLEKIPGAGEVEFETLGRTPLLEIAARRDALRRHALGAAELNRTVASALGGETVGALRDGERRIDLVVRLAETARADPAVLPTLPVRVGEHGLLPLGDLADLRETTTVSPILRDAGRRRAALLVNLDTSDIAGWVATARAAVRDHIELPPGVTIEFGGQFENLVAARQRLALVVPATLALIFGLVVLAFGRVRQALIVYTGIPLALTGGVFALWARDLPFSITAAIGFIALSGVAVLNGVVLVSAFNDLRAQGRRVRDAVLEGSLLRLRPVLMTALVASLGFLPMALATGPGAEVQRPLATVVIGGILSATLLTLLLLPALYAWVERDAEPARPMR
ncbi:CusA/CzcA family heavy metal efflux RND transporter [Horticoccus luteus]|uniref:CusA/CzcA family heavy metal efflux RND transporter n=1 Tax=Horticoccus luteus TaxID=2862869 RepID=A0A8F9XKN4_9BACT|nr:CusA/CzcA family heavy metal efflux RND transporter [Horticoccus luteus]QYM78234.1 CusA/CzcA family heavy metal efflux RND transporter [Horticoccus luteus]